MKLQKLEVPGGDNAIMGNFDNGNVGGWVMRMGGGSSFCRFVNGAGALRTAIAGDDFPGSLYTSV